MAYNDDFEKPWEGTTEDLAEAIGAEFGDYDTDESGSIDMFETGVGFEEHGLWFLEQFDISEEDLAEYGLESLEAVFEFADDDSDGEVTALEAATAIVTGLGDEWTGDDADFDGLVEMIG